eukprot:g46145.t1
MSEDGQKAGEQAHGQKDEEVLGKTRTTRKGKVGMSEDRQKAGEKMQNVAVLKKGNKRTRSANEDIGILRCSAQVRCDSSTS